METTSSSLHPLVLGRDGLRGHLEPGDDNSSSVVPVRLEDGRQVLLPRGLLLPQADGSFTVSLGLSDLDDAATGQPAPRADTIVVVPVIAETAVVTTRTVESGGIRVHKTVDEREERVDAPLRREIVHVETVPVHRFIDGPLPGIREEGDTVIIPVIEEVLVVEKRLLLREEVHVRREQQIVHEPQTVVLRRESVTVERMEADEIAPRDTPAGGVTSAQNEAQP